MVGRPHGCHRRSNFTQCRGHFFGNTQGIQFNTDGRFRNERHCRHLGFLFFGRFFFSELTKLSHQNCFSGRCCSNDQSFGHSHGLWVSFTGFYELWWKDVPTFCLLKSVIPFSNWQRGVHENLNFFVKCNKFIFHSFDEIQFVKSTNFSMKSQWNRHLRNRCCIPPL